MPADRSRSTGAGNRRARFDPYSGRGGRNASVNLDPSENALVRGPGVNLGNSLLTSHHMAERDAGVVETRADSVQPKQELDENEDDPQIRDPASQDSSSLAISSQAIRQLPPASLDEDQQDALELTAGGRLNVFLTGPAGCGKSTVLTEIRRELREKRLRVACLAPTGCAALAIKGRTIHSFAGLGAQMNRPLDWFIEHGRTEARQPLRDLDVLIIDEVSMMSKELLERFDAVMRSARSSDLPLGGVQTIFIGDFRQLPPVKPFEFCITCGDKRQFRKQGTEFFCRRHGTVCMKDQWAFKSPVWQQLQFTNILLRQVHRQTSGELLDLLNYLWLGRALTWEEVERLEDNVTAVDNAITLYARKEDVEAHNHREFERLNGEIVSYECLDKFEHQWKLHPHLGEFGDREWRSHALKALRDHRYTMSLQLRVGMPVILLHNLSVQEGLVNGSQGKIVGFVHCNDTRAPRERERRHEPNYDPETNHNHEDFRGSMNGSYATKRQDNINEFNAKNSGKIPLMKFPNHNNPVAIFPECSISEHGYETPHSLLMRTQIPLLGAWAITIHKSQGMTLDPVVVDLANYFQEQQTYVALSRAKDRSRLVVKNARGEMIGGSRNPEVTEFLIRCFPELRAEFEA